MANKEAGSSIRLENLTKKYGKDVIASNNISFEIHRGEFITLLGASGSGKTTILMMIAGFQTPDEGNIYIDEVQITKLPPHIRNIGMVFQHYALFPHMTIFENIAFSLSMRKVSESEIEERVNSILRLVELPKLGGRFPKQLSGGQQQRVALARALVFNPKVLLMDEPLGALDKKLREQMQLQIKRMQEKLKITCVYVTHDQGEALTMSDRIVILNNGKIEQANTPLEIYKNPCNKYVADFIGESNILTGEINDIKNGIATIKTDKILEVKVCHNAVQNMKGKVNFIIRPEKILVINSENNELANVFDAVIDEIIYLGENTKYIVTTKEGEVLNIKQQNVSDIQIYKKGSLIRLGWGLNDGVLV